MSKFLSYKTVLLILCVQFAYFTASGAPVAAAATVNYELQASCPRLQTQIQTNHQGEHEVNRVRAYLNSGVTTIRFTAGLPAYWLGVGITVNRDQFEIVPSGVSFVSGEVEFEVQSQNLNLEKRSYRSGDIIDGNIDLTFSEGDETYYFKGCFSGIVRPEGFDALNSQGIRMIGAADMDIAIYELGEPLKESYFAAREADRTRNAIFQGSLKDPNREIRELTWNISPEAELTLSGDERLTIWFHQVGDRWRSAGYKVWNKVSDPLPSLPQER